MNDPLLIKLPTKSTYDGRGLVLACHLHVATSLCLEQQFCYIYYYWPIFIAIFIAIFFAIFIVIGLYLLLLVLSFVIFVTITKERTNQDRTKIGPFFDFLLHNSIFLFEILIIASQLSCKAMPKISSKNIEKCRRKSMKGPFLVLSW